ncbi:hypothetical protein RFM99_28120 [Mesorhizobium sp. VK4C]|uniref:hypothetical protein n=1 Tax=Mesorhizobium captivum TaxID=3072319 RepID=UPI002A239CFA|nr:hypothetical protein [Mesorhizobium sp. VK4C]MDX8502265.1 hypothetical protein [Mesorhizobium sp. VK4C]
MNENLLSGVAPEGIRVFPVLGFQDPGDTFDQLPPPVQRKGAYVRITHPSPHPLSRRVCIGGLENLVNSAFFAGDAQWNKSVGQARWTVPR